MRKLCAFGLLVGLPLGPLSLSLLGAPTARADVPPPAIPEETCTDLKPPPGQFCTKCTDGHRSCQRTFTWASPSWDYRCTSNDGEYWCLPWADKEPPKIPTPPPSVPYSQKRYGSSYRPSPPRPPTDEELAETGIMGLIDPTLSKREGDKLTLYIDKGAAAGITVGTEGVVLDGRSGTMPMPIPRLRVVRVLDDTHCVAEVAAKSLGKARRVSLFRKK